MRENDSNKGRKGRRKRKHGSERAGSQGRAGLLISIATGTSLGALIGLVIGYFLAPRPRGASAEPRQALKAWREMVRKLSEQLQAGGTR